MGAAAEESHPFPQQRWLQEDKLAAVVKRRYFLEKYGLEAQMKTSGESQSRAPVASRESPPPPRPPLLQLCDEATMCFLSIEKADALVAHATAIPRPAGTKKEKKIGGEWRSQQPRSDALQCSAWLPER